MNVDDTDTATNKGKAAPVPLLQMLQLTDLPGADGADAPVCGPDGCAVPTAVPTALPTPTQE